MSSSLNKGNTEIRELAQPHAEGHEIPEKFEEFEGVTSAKVGGEVKEKRQRKLTEKGK